MRTTVRIGCLAAVLNLASGQGTLSGYGAPGSESSQDPAVLALSEAIPGNPGEDYPIYATPPETSFSCDGYIEGYYADPEADCQMFHICANDGNGGLIKYSFLCPNGTLFNQQYFICDWWFNVDCSQAEDLYSLNEEVAAAAAAATAAAGLANGGGLDFGINARVGRLGRKVGMEGVFSNSLGNNIQSSGVVSGLRERIEKLPLIFNDEDRSGNSLSVGDFPGDNIEVQIRGGGKSTLRLQGGLRGRKGGFRLRKNGFNGK